MNHRLAALFALTILSGPGFASSAFAQAPATPAKPEKWNVSAPPGLKTREIRIAVDNGTWMNVDVSHDGKLIAFDLLGDIYVMPIGGGTPTRIAEGWPTTSNPGSRPTTSASPSPPTAAAGTTSG